MTHSRIAIVPARGGSKRIKNKNVVDFCGAPLMSYSLQAARQSGLFDCIHISTEDPAIARVATELGFPPTFMRDPALADDYTPLRPVLRWTLEQYAARGTQFDTVCLLFPTAPLIRPEDLRQAEALFQEHGGRRTVLAVSRFPVPVEWAFRQMPDGTLVAREPGMAEHRSQDLDPSYYDAGAFVFYSAASVVDRGPENTESLAYLIERSRAVDIDDAEDLEFARVLYRGLRSCNERP